jgi:hypothetical protein
MTLDMVRLSAAIDAALPLLDAAGKDEHAHALRTQSPALFRLARIGQDLRSEHSAELQRLRDQVVVLQAGKARDCRECEYHPHDLQPTTDRSGNGG